jgi:predicted Zn-dependent protease
MMAAMRTGRFAALATLLLAACAPEAAAPSADPATDSARGSATGSVNGAGTGAAAGPATGSAARAAPAGAQGPAGLGPKAPPARSPRPRSPELDALRRAVEFGDVERARALLTHAAPAEARLLRARLALLEDQAVEAMRLLEAAKAEDRSNPETWATAAEVYAARGAFDTAWAEVRAGEAQVGEPPEIRRAKGVCWIARPGGVERGLEHLLAARAADPELPFCDRALAQAHLLAAKKRVQEEDLAQALALVRTSLGYDPRDPDARRLLSDVQAGLGDHEAALAELQALEKDGEPLGAEVALAEKRAGFAALLAKDRARALDHFRRARARGLSDEALSSAAAMLAEEAALRVEQGVRRFRAGELERAEESFRAALSFDPKNLAAQNHLAVARLRAGDAQEAAALWRAVLDAARAERIELPEPVHVNLAQAELLLGREAQARALLERYLSEEPEGPWAAPTRELLARMAHPR